MRHLCIGRALFRVPYKGHLLFARMQIDQKDIPRAHLRGSEQPRNRADYIALDGALQVACCISGRCPLSAGTAFLRSLSETGSDSSYDPVSASALAPIQ